MDFNGKVVAITGGAGDLGASQVRLFHARGATVAILDIDDATGEALATELGDRAFYLRLDVTSPKDWATAVTEIESRAGRLDAFVNNAGYFRPRPLLETPEDEFDLAYAVNEKGVFLGMKAVIPLLRKSGKGSIVNIASGAAVRGLPNAFGYVATKWSVRGMSLAAAAEHAAENIRVNVIFPGTIDTKMSRSNTPERLERIKSTIPMGRLGTPDEIGNMVVFLSSDAASYVTGAEIRIDGGRHL